MSTVVSRILARNGIVSKNAGYTIAHNEPSGESLPWHPQAIRDGLLGQVGSPGKPSGH